MMPRRWRGAIRTYRASGSMKSCRNRAEHPSRQTDVRASRARLFSDVLGEYPDDIALHDRCRVEHVGCDALDGISQRHKLRLPGQAFGPLDAGKLVHGGVTDLAFDGLVPIQHGELERQSLVVVSYNSAPGQRHRTTNPY